MNGPTPLGELTEAIGGGLSQPRHAWEILAIMVAIIGAVVLARVAGTARPGPGRYGGALPRLYFPLIGLVLLGVAEALLRWQHVVASGADARLMRLAASLLGTLLAVRVLLALLRRVVHNLATITRLERAIGAAGVLGIGLYATGWLGDVVGWLASVRIPLGSAAEVSLWSVLIGSTTMVLSLLAAMWAGSLIEERLDSETGLEPNLRTVLGRVARALLLVVAVLLALAFSGIDLTILSVFGGALGVGLGLGLQRIASNYVSGFILLLDRSLRIGDMVAVDKYYGQVTQISTRYTVLRAADGTEAIVPNEMLVSSPVVNSTLGNRRVELGVQVTVGPDVDLPLALRLMREAAQAPVRVQAEPTPLAMLKEFAAGNLLLEVNFSIADPENGRPNVQSDVAIGIFERFRAAGIELAVPRGGFALAGLPPWMGAPADKPGSGAN